MDATPEDVAFDEEVLAVETKCAIDLITAVARLSEDRTEFEYLLGLSARYAPDTLTRRVVRWHREVSGMTWTDYRRNVRRMFHNARKDG